MATATLSFPQSLTEAYKPQTLTEFCGLEKQRKILTNLAANPRPCALLFEGASGTGKTSMAYAFARAIGAEVKHIGSQEATVENVKEVVRMCHYVPLSGGWHVVVIDEVDKASSATQLYLLSKLDGTEPCPNTVFVFTANDVESLQDRFLSRCIRLPKFNAYPRASLRDDGLQYREARATHGVKPKNITDPQLVVWMTREQIESVDDILRRLGSDDAEAIRRTLTRAAAEADTMHTSTTDGTGTK